MKKGDTLVHKINFKKEPIWLRCNFVGTYDNIKFRFTYNEYAAPDVDNIVKTYKFNWPGKIPEDKDFAEQGIKALFNKLRTTNNSTIKMEVSKDTTIFMHQSEIVDNLVTNELIKIEENPDNYENL